MSEQSTNPPTTGEGSDKQQGTEEQRMPQKPLPKNPLLNRKAKERKYFDSADWAMGKTGAEKKG
jgi:hypothetical protein